ncbi:MAG: glycosyltransferase family 1 protein [Parcubacteria group bacterium]|jgi:glycosyltransferase involved in cell wall biosynthesis
MNIGINASFMRKPGTGIGQVTTHFLHELIRRSHTDRSFKNHKFFIYSEELIDMDFPKNFTCRHFLPHYYRRDDLFRRLLWEKFSLPCCAHRDKCDVLISLYQSATVIKYTDMRHIMVVHDVIPHIFAEYLDNMRKKIYWKYVEKGMYGSHKIIAVSEYTKIDLATRLNIKEQKITVAPIAVDPIFSNIVSQEEMDRVMDVYKLESKKYIYTGGGLELRKCADRTLRAYKMLRERIPDAPTLVISGKLMPELAPLIVDVEQIVYDLGLVDHVRIIGFVPQADLPALYKGAVCFVFPSLYEGFGMPVLEAMNIGTPVITSRDSSLSEVGGDAVVYAEHDDEALCEKMREVILDHTLQEMISAKEKEQAQKFSWQSFVEKIWETVTM